jgi:hypothetical protein|nr:MAG TPA: hypothetical protein [Caudoviricetes sp.]
MGYYSGRLIINNDTDNDIKVSMEQCLIATLRFSASFNKKRLYLNNTILKQILESGVVQDYIVNECSSYFKNNNELINNRINKNLTKENAVKIDIKIIGKYFYIKFYCGRNHTIDDCIAALIRKLKNEKDQLEILRGE